MNKGLFWIFSLFLFGLLGCSEPSVVIQPIEVTTEVTRQIEITREVEVTRLFEVTRQTIVEVTRLVEIPGVITPTPSPAQNQEVIVNQRNAHFISTEHTKNVTCPIFVKNGVERFSGIPPRTVKLYDGVNSYDFSASDRKILSFC